MCWFFSYPVITFNNTLQRHLKELQGATGHSYSHLRGLRNSLGCFSHVKTIDLHYITLHLVCLILITVYSVFLTFTVYQHYVMMLVQNWKSI